VEYADAAGSGCTSCTGASGSLPSRTVYPTFEKNYTYDSRNRKVSEADHLDDKATHFSGFAYDAVGNLTARTDKLGRTTWHAYDALNRLTSVTDPAGGITQYTYDDRDNLIALIDAEDRTTRFEYDASNRLVKEIRPRGAATVYAYDATGNLVEKIDAKNQKAAYLYDDAGRLEQIRYFAAAGDTVPAKTVIFSYDNLGNLTGYDDGTTSAVYEYDSLYRKTAETVNYGSFSLSSGYTYYDNGLKKTYTGPDAVTYGYLYDANNQLAGVQIPDAGYATVSEYRWNRPAAMLLPGGTTKTFDYDPLMRVKQITARDPAANPVLNYAFEYDRMDNITAKATGHGYYGYAYDDRYRLTDVDNPVLNDEAFTYDGVGNRLTSADTASEWTYNENNELTGHGDVTYDYDLNGNLIEKSAAGVVTKFFYNLEDRLERVEDGSGNVVASYYYDPFGRRLWKEVGGTRTYFQYSDAGLVGEYDVDGSVIKTYGYKPGSTWTTDPLFMRQNGHYYFYHNDHLGTSQVVTTTSGAVVWKAKHTSFGKASVDPESSVVNPLKMPGQYEDVETGLYYNWHRYYDPKIGRYLRADPIGLDGGINLYAYVENNPLTRNDFRGLDYFGHPSGLLGDASRSPYNWPSFPGYKPLLGNGNFTPGSWPQDGVCSAPAGLFNNWRCTKECCKKHDECYAGNGCNASSWWGLIFGHSSACKKCNTDAAACIKRNLGKDNCCK
jgi:RHS repeat-associated protein